MIVHIFKDKSMIHLHTLYNGHTDHFPEPAGLFLQCWEGVVACLPALSEVVQRSNQPEVYSIQQGGLFPSYQHQWIISTSA